MNYIKILILFSAVFCMETFGMAYIQRRDLLCEKPLSDRIKYLFPMTPKRRIFYGLLTCVIWVFSVMAELVKNTERVFPDVKNSVVAAAVVFVICILCKCLIKNGIGMGDIKLFMVMGLLQGISGMSGAIFMSMIVAFFGSVGMLIFKKKTRKDNISFGPFILIGTTISMFLAGV